MLVRQGWDHLRLQRPLAAWSCWRQALRIKPEDPAATEALEILEASPELPAAARVPLRPAVPLGRGKAGGGGRPGSRGATCPTWSRAAEAFADLTGDDPEDSAAWFNLGLGRAWLGRNVEAIEALDRSVALDAVPRPEAAVASWALAEVLRLGAAPRPWPTI